MSYKISGKVLDRRTRQGVEGILVEAWDKDLIFDDKLADAVTEANGAFGIQFEEDQFNDLFFDRKPDLYFKLFRGDKLIHSTKDSVVWNVERQDIVQEIFIDDVEATTTSQITSSVGSQGTTRHLLQATYTPRKPRPEENPSLRASGLEKASFISQLAPTRDELDELTSGYKGTREQATLDSAKSEKMLATVGIIANAIAPTGGIKVRPNAKLFASMEVDVLCQLARDLVDLRLAKLAPLAVAHKTMAEQAAQQPPKTSVKDLLEWAISHDVEVENAHKTFAVGNALSLNLEQIALTNFIPLAAAKFQRLRERVDECEKTLTIEPVGYLHLEKLSFTPVGIERGELVYSVPLSPGEEVNIRHREWSRTSEEFERIVTDYKEEFSEEGVTEKTELAQAVNSQTQHATAFNTSVSTSGEAFGFSISASVGYNASDSASKSEQITRNHSRELTSKASSRSKQEHKISFRVASARETEDETVQRVKNPFSDRATRIDYYQLIRKWQVDLYRYGIRLTWDIGIPEPGSGLLSKLIEIRNLRKELEVRFDEYFTLKPTDINRQNYLDKASGYGVSLEDVLPPEEFKRIFISETHDWPKELNEDRPIIFQPIEFELPEGYKIKDVKDEGEETVGVLLNFYIRRDPNYKQWGIAMKDLTASVEDFFYVKGNDDTNEVDISETILYTGWNGKSGKIALVIRHWRIEQISIGIEIETILRDPEYQSWKERIWRAISEGARNSYYELRQILKDKLAQLEEELGTQDALSLRKKEREEVMKSVLRFLLCPDLFQFFPDNILPAKEEVFNEDEAHNEDNSPNIEDLYNSKSGLIKNEEDRKALLEQGEVIKFLHQAIEWENMLYFLYPYFWTHPSQWEFKKYLEHPDPQHRAFLKAGSARVVLTIRPGFEDAFLAFTQTGEMDGLPETPYLEIGQEFKNYANTNYPGIRAANPVENARPLLTSKQRQAWEKMQVLMNYLEEYRLWSDYKQYRAWKDLQALTHLLARYWQICGRYPFMQEGLLILSSCFPDETVPHRDPWGTPYSYSYHGKTDTYTLCSLGADGQPGGVRLNADIFAIRPEPQRAYPNSLNLLKDYFGLDPFFDNQGNWKKDSWGREYHYSYPGQYGAYDLASYGADGKEGGEGENADITSWAEASLIGQWYEYTPTSALDIAFDERLPLT